MVQLQKLSDAFEARGVTVIAMSQEDRDLESHARITSKIEGDLRFQLTADLNRQRSERYDRATTYLIDQAGTVRQVMPQMVRRRVDWHAVLNELDRLGIGIPPDGDERGGDDRATGHDAGHGQGRSHDG